MEKAVHEELRELCQVSRENQMAEFQQLQSRLQERYGITNEPVLT